MKTLRASALRIQSDVVVGRNQYGGDVTVAITLDRKDPDVVAALDPLDRLLRQRAFHHLNEAIEERVVQQLVTQRVNAMRQQITAAAKVNAEATLFTKVTGLERELTSIRRQLEAATTENERWRQRASTTSTTEQE